MGALPKAWQWALVLLLVAGDALALWLQPEFFVCARLASMELESWKRL